ncbi:MAG: DUF3298 domain-containing protein [Eubacterium sp.]|nr:DUF3298 domain-containing protein [Eubacterium sp.]
MKHRFPAILCIILLLFNLAGCGSSGTAETTGVSGETVSAAEKTGDEKAEAEKAAANEETVAARPEPQLSSMYIYESDSENKTVYVHGSHDTLRLSEESGKQFPALSAALDQYMNKETEEVKKLKRDYADNYKTDDSLKEFAPNGCEITDKLFVRRADKRVLSILESNSGYGGGVHGYFSYSTLNLDAETGKDISLDDIVTDKERLGTILKKQLKEENSENSFFEWMEETIDKEINEISEDGIDWKLTWTLDPQGVTFYFNPYDIGPWAAGAFTTTILYDQEDGLFTDNYRPVEGSGQVCAFPTDTDFNADLDKDGKADHIRVSCEMDENGDSIQKLTVGVNDKDLSINDMYCYSVEPKALLTEDGHVYLYAWCRGDNDYVQMYIFDLSSGAPVSYDPMNLSEDWTYTEEEKADYISWETQITDPSSMLLTSRFDILSTYTGCRSYHLEDGPVPVSDDKVFTIKADITLVSVKEIKATPVDKEGNVTGDPVKIPAKSSFTLKYTDGKNHVDALLKDGSMVRLEITGDYPQYIDGVNAEELFEKLYFAG